VIRGLALAAVLAGPAFAQEGPQAGVTLDPEGPVTVGTPLRVTATVLVPSYMPQPPAWPDLQIADAITRSPERATHPVTQRVGGESWSGLARTWEIIPQRAADYDLGAAEAVVTYADPETNAPVEARLTLPDIAFSATVPAGAEGMDPFLAATSLTLTATLDGLPETPKPGDAFTLTLTTTAVGPPAMLLPALADRLPTPEGLRAYPRQPALADGATATRTEAITYVTERPGDFDLPSISLGWWNTDDQARETAATEALMIHVEAPPGWPPSGGPVPLRNLVWIALAVLAVAALLVLLARRRRRPPSSAALRRVLRAAARSAPPAEIRARLAAWRESLPRPLGAATENAIERALRSVERPVYGLSTEAGAEAAARRAFVAEIDAARYQPGPTTTLLPGLNLQYPEEA
jgi:hypothetical protein